MRRATGEHATIAARWVVGADGARSMVRRALGLAFAGRTYDQTGLLADVDLAFPAGSGPAAGSWGSAQPSSVARLLPRRRA